MAGISHSQTVRTHRHPEARALPVAAQITAHLSLGHEPGRILHPYETEPSQSTLVDPGVVMSQGERGHDHTTCIIF